MLKELFSLTWGTHVRISDLKCKTVTISRLHLYFTWIYILIGMEYMQRCFLMIKILFVNLKGSDNMEKNNTKQPI